MAIPTISDISPREKKREREYVLIGEKSKGKRLGEFT
jgi:hypothetical protein